LNRGATNRGRGGGGQTAQTAAPSGSLGHPSMHNNGSALMAEAIVADGGESEEDGEEVEGRQVSPAFVPRDGDAASEDGDAATGGRGMNM